jgi:glycine oxidase
VAASAVAVGVGPVVTLSNGGRLGADCVLLAAGIGTTLIEGLEAAGLPEIRPVKGHILRLGPSTGTPSLPCTVRGLVRGRSVYLVPRPDNTVVIGATVEERGVDTAVQAGAVHQLLDDARSVVPGIDEMVLLEANAGLRPSTPDNMPCIGWTRLPGVAVASGHYRNGILLAPLTAHALVTLLADEPVSPLVAVLAPAGAP